MLPLIQLPSRLNPQTKTVLLAAITSLALAASWPAQADDSSASPALVLNSPHLKSGGELKLDNLFYETARGRTSIPARLGKTKMPDGRTVTVAVSHQGHDFT